METEYLRKEEIFLELEYELITEYIKARKGKFTQEELAKKSNIVRQTINRIENGATSPQLLTMLKLLKPLGLTLKIVPIKESEE